MSTKLPDAVPFVNVALSWLNAQCTMLPTLTYEPVALDGTMVEVRDLRGWIRVVIVALYAARYEPVTLIVVLFDTLVSKNTFDAFTAALKKFIDVPLAGIFDAAVVMPPSTLLMYGALMIWFNAAD